MKCLNCETEISEFEKFCSRLCLQEFIILGGEEE